jgi:hypothetical protein
MERGNGHSVAANETIEALYRAMRRKRRSVCRSSDNKSRKPKGMQCAMRQQEPSLSSMERPKSVGEH